MARDFAKAFYESKAWKQCRHDYIELRHGLCERCGRPGNIVHHKTHITPANINDPDITLNFDNLKCVCQGHQMVQVPLSTWQKLEKNNMTQIQLLEKQQTIQQRQEAQSGQQQEQVKLLASQLQTAQERTQKAEASQQSALKSLETANKSLALLSTQIKLERRVAKRKRIQTAAWTGFLAAVGTVVAIKLA